MISIERVPKHRVANPFEIREILQARLVGYEGCSGQANSEERRPGYVGPDNRISEKSLKQVQ